jgi:hypothetical protein
MKADLQGERKPGLDPAVHRSEIRVLVIMVQEQAFAHFAL